MKPDAIAFARRFDGVSGSAIREIFKMIAKPGMISFAGGNPALSALPDQPAAEMARKVLEENGKAILQYGATEGYPPLLESLKSYVQAQLGCEIPAVLPVTGSTQAMDLLCKALINPGDVILLENPSFLGNMQCMHLYEARLVPVESDENGLIPAKLEEAIQKHHPKMLYTIPTFQNPTGVTMPLERRKRIAELAAQYDILVAEDDPYHSLRYTGESLPAIKAFDMDGHVALMGSFSKVISPGLRVGFLVCEPKLLRKCVICKQSDDLHTANLNQAVVDAYLRRDLLRPHVQEVCARYGAQLNCMLSALEEMQGVQRFTRPEGGLFIFAYLKDNVNATEMLMKAVDRGVAYVPGTYFYPDGGHENTLRLNFSNADIPTIERGMALLNDCLK